MEKFLQVDLLGNLYFEEIFLFYEEPLLFSCKNLFGHTFLLNCIDISEDSKTLLALPISRFKLEQVKGNTVSLHDAFKNPEDGFLWSIHENCSEEIAMATHINPLDIGEEDLPSKNSYIEIEQVEDKYIIANEAFDKRALLAETTNRVVFDISLEVNESHSTEITPDVLAKTIVELQDTLFSIAHKNGTVNSSFPSTIIDDNQLNIVSTYAASFGIRFMSKQLCDVFGELSVTRNIEILLQLLTTTDDSVRIRELLEQMNPKVSIHYRKLLSNLVSNKTALKMYYSTPKKPTREISLSLEDLKTSLTTIESEIENIIDTITSTGILVGVNVNTNTFSFKPDNEKIITGKLSKTVNVKKFTVPLKATISLEVNVKINQVIQKEIVEYTLIGIFNQN